jgi:hypothetical protein
VQQAANKPIPVKVTREGEAAEPVGPRLVRSLGVGSVFGLTAAFHGYRRSGGNLFWAVVWGVGGALCPIIVLPMAFNQGYAQKAKG